jgi:hypothetical protein
MLDVDNDVIYQRAKFELEISYIRGFKKITKYDRL